MNQSNLVVNPLDLREKLRTSTGYNDNRKTRFVESGDVNMDNIAGMNKTGNAFKRKTESTYALP